VALEAEAEGQRIEGGLMEVAVLHQLKMRVVIEMFDQIGLVARLPGGRCHFGCSRSRPLGSAVLHRRSRT